MSIREAPELQILDLQARVSLIEAILPLLIKDASDGVRAEIIAVASGIREQSDKLNIVASGPELAGLEEYSHRSETAARLLLGFISKP